MTQEKREQFDRIAPLIGRTPLLEIHYRFRGEARRLFAKMESYNLTGNIKDRVAFHILRKAYERGTIQPGDRIIEATSGNTASPSRPWGGIWGTMSSSTCLTG